MIQKLLTEAKKWLGYKEKATDHALDAFDSNIGWGNYTCFNRDFNLYLGSIKPNEEWCWTYIVMCFFYTFGKDITRYYLDGQFILYDGLLKDPKYRIPAKNNKPQPGDIAVFFDLTTKYAGHVALVSEVSDTTFTTLEGNIPGRNNGGEVVSRQYSLSYPYVYYYCRPLYNQIHIGDRQITQGSKGNDVKELQEILNANGYDCGTADGIFGLKTFMAVKQYQAKQGISADGVVGKLTALKISKMGAEELTKHIEDTNYVVNRNLHYSCVGNDVKWLQTQLNDRGYNCGKVDGVFGNATLYAVKQFQKANYLAVDGIAGKNTLTLLGGILELR